ncbi:hypothetical protein [Sulfitobacter sp. R18_1]|uniref:hypothetical protein n=1 Tax=Sulfitobacter sp. R18_1 TaxID=2821104 RepID=UPI001ADA551C|nr:hypothetical protein [Sulfitobacter sp. R18_1]MBO9428098.1 hypothetical protein [Sulfitobacter sp. R18_1]
MKLPHNVQHAMRLCRKNQELDGWCKASKVVLENIIPEVPEDLMEREVFESGAGRVRLTERGNVVADYL